MANGNKVLIAVYVPPAVREQLQRLATSEGRPLSNYIARHLIAHVKRPRRPPEPVELPAS
jgi:hypothetical protein